MSHDIGLADLVGDRDAFLADPPEAPAVWRPPAGALAGLPTLGDLDRLLEGPVLARSVRVYDKGFVEAPAFTRVTNAGHLADGAQISRLFRAGATVTINDLNLYSEPVRGLVRSIARESATPVEAVAFITGEGCDGLMPHFDPNDIFAIQLAGAKKWSFWRPAIQNPVRGGDEEYFSSQEWRTATGASPDVEITLTAGDVLWLPRGWIHATTGAHGVSVHVSLVFKNYTYQWLVEKLVAHLAHGGLGERLPFRWATDQELTAELIEEAAGRFGSAVRAADHETTSKLLTRAVADDFPESPSSLGRANGTTSGDASVAFDHDYVRLVRRLAGGRVELVGGDTSATVDGSVAAFLAGRWAAGPGAVWSARDLGDAVPPDQAAAFVEDLIRNGFVRVVG